VKPLVEVCAATIITPAGRPLFHQLDLRLTRERVAIVGRNGVGKSTLLAVLAGQADLHAGCVKVASRPHFVPQSLPARAASVSGTGPGHAHSSGELRKLALYEARESRAEILLLDEPTEDLDEAGVAWLRSWLPEWRGCLVIASHDRRLLADFRHFFVASETGCRYFSGALAEIETDLEREQLEAEGRYVKNLNRLAAHEQRATHLTRRKARKKRYGRCSELDRATPRIRLNQKRDQAQVSHGRSARVQQARIDAMRQWSKSMRRALGVSFSVEMPVPALPNEASDAIVLCNVSARVEERWLFRSLALRIGRERIGVVGANGSGKTTLLDVMMGRRTPATGSAFRKLSRIGCIEQGGANWATDDTLLDQLGLEARLQAPDGAARLLVAHKFPLALAERPLRSLSPGERTRAALICLFRRSPPPELLVLDEPTFSLDLVGQRALTSALRAWPGGLVVASHDRAFLAAIRLDEWIHLGQ
jgi:ATPase subunit of ABC transporter with duplicated ATPase domains